MSASRARPRRVIDLDGLPAARWPIAEDAVFVYRGKLWVREPVGCVLCVELEGPEFITLCHVDDDGREHFLCMSHGALEAVGYTISKLYKIVLGHVERDGEETLSDSMLLPAEVTLAARTELIERLLDEAQAEEEEAGPVPQ